MQVATASRKLQKQVFDEYTAKLINCLPMDDSLFISSLSTHHLLPGDTENKLKALPTQADKASYFLCHVIKPALDIDDTSNFDNLLSVMEKCGYAHVNKLTHDINSKIYVVHKAETGMEYC